MAASTGTFTAFTSLPYQLPTSSGDEVLGAYRAIFSAIKLDVAFTIDDVTVDGDTAHALTRSKGKVTVLADGTVTPEENRELFVFGRHVCNISCFENPGSPSHS